MGSYSYQDKITEACDSIKTLLLEKNKAYGDSAFKDVRVLGKTIEAKDAVLARISDKLKRIDTLGLDAKDNAAESVNDSLNDLIGYLIILKILTS